MSSLESALLGALLDAANPALGDQAALIDAAGLRPEDITDVRVRGAWQLAERMVLARKPLDAQMLFAEGIKRKLVREDSLGWLQQLESNNTLDRLKFTEIATNVRIQSRRAALSQLLKEQAAALDRGGDIEDAAHIIEGACFDANSLGLTHETGDVDVDEIDREWEERERTGTSLLVPTGTKAVDAVIGGWVDNLNVVCGLPSVGKSAFLGTCVEQQLRAGVKVGLFGLEDGTRWLPKRLLARELDMPLREVGWSQRSPERQERYVDSANRISQLLKSLVTYRRDSITTDELCRRITHWVTNLGVKCVYVDHGGEVEHRRDGKGDDFRLAVGDTYRRLRNLAVRYRVPIVVLAHTTRASDRATPWGDEAPPKVSEIAESAYIERRARIVLGLWKRMNEPDSMRVTVLKATEGKPGDTVRIDRLTASALLDPMSGTEINLHAERAAESRKRKEKKEADRLAGLKAKTEAKSAAKAAKEANKPAQGILGEVDARN